MWVWDQVEMSRLREGRTRREPESSRSASVIVFISEQTEERRSEWVEEGRTWKRFIARSSRPAEMKEDSEERSEFLMRSSCRDERKEVSGSEEGGGAPVGE